jgi:outer membrane protein assembly factor BamB
VGSGDGKLYALKAADGKLVWSYLTGGEVASSPAIANGTVIFGSYDGKLYALDAQVGALKWSYATGDKLVSSPAVANGAVYVGSYDHMVYAFGSALNRPNSSNSVPMVWIVAAVVIVIGALITAIAFYTAKRRQ